MALGSGLRLVGTASARRSKRAKNEQHGEEMGEIWVNACEGRELTKDRWAAGACAEPIQSEHAGIAAHRLQVSEAVGASIAGRAQARGSREEGGVVVGCLITLSSRPSSSGQVAGQTPRWSDCRFVTPYRPAGFRGAGGKMLRRRTARSCPRS